MKVPAGRRVPACVALGSNLADPVEQVLRALEELSVLPQTRLVARSRLWHTRAVGPPQPDYVNAAVRLETALEPEELFERLLAIEAAHGRTRGQRWGPRTLDLDLLLFGDRSLDTPRLTVPHPRLAERAFVLLPLAEVAGDLDVPGHGRVASLAAASMAGGVAAIPALGTMEPLWNNALNPGLTMRGATISTLMQMKAAGEKIAALTAYDASFAKLAEEAGVDLLLVGDSLAMVVQGHESTLPATVGEMVYHTAAVARGAARALLVADMPFMSYGSPEQALESAGRLMKEGGAHMVKLEGGAPQVETVRHLTRHAVPVCAHLGLLPQSVYQLGGYRVQGRDAATARQIREDALALQAAGAQLLVLECVPAVLAAEVTAALAIPVIGIGAGPDTDGQVLVVYDVVGIAPGRPPSFVRNFLTGSGSVREALAAYVQAVKDRSFPAQEHCYA